VVVIVVTDTGRVSQRVAFLPNSPRMPPVRSRRSHDWSPASPSPRPRPRSSISRHPPHGTRIDRRVAQRRPHRREELEDFRQDRLVMAGSATLARRESDFRGSIYPLLEAIEEQVTLLRLMGEMVADEHGLAASIGRENEPFGLTEASVLTSEYDATAPARASAFSAPPAWITPPTSRRSAPSRTI
jgi:heat-inducible transcriptional repressor